MSAIYSKSLFFLLAFTCFTCFAMCSLAATPPEDSLRFTVRYATTGGEVTVCFTNTSEKTQTFQCVNAPYLAAVSVEGEQLGISYHGAVQPLTQYLLPPGGSKSFVLNPSIFWPEMTPGVGYFITIAGSVLETRQAVTFTFPYIAPQATSTFSGDWVAVPGRKGVQARLAVTLPTADWQWHGAARLEYRNTGKDKGTVDDLPILDAEVRHDGEQAPLVPVRSVKVVMRRPNPITLPVYASISLPIMQYGRKASAVPKNRISLWLGEKQYLLPRGERFHIDAIEHLSAGGINEAVEVPLTLELTVPSPTAPAPEMGPALISLQYDDKSPLAPPHICVNNMLTHPLRFTQDDVSITDANGHTPAMVWAESADSLTVGPSATIPAGGTLCCHFRPMATLFHHGELYMISGAWKVVDEENKQQYTVTTRFPYFSPAEFPTFVGPWTAVKERAGLSCRLRVKLTPGTPPWQPSTWVEYRNEGTEGVKIFDYPNVAPQLTDAGEKMCY